MSKQNTEALRYFLMDRVLTIFNCIIFILAECNLLNDLWKKSAAVLGDVLYLSQDLIVQLILAEHMFQDIWNMIYEFMFQDTACMA